MNSPENVWTARHLVRAADMDPFGRMTALALCEALQEAAGDHARALGFGVEQLLARGITWVLARFELEVADYPAWQQPLTIETWPSGLAGLVATREFLVHGPDGAALARATSGWMVVDARRKRPVRPPAELDTVRRPDRPRALEFTAPRIGAPAAADAAVPFDVRWRDLDLNQHVNNVTYVEWVLESLPIAFHAAHQLERLAIDYRAECRAGDAVTVEREPAGAAVLHRIVRRSDGKECTAALTRWRARRP